MPDCLPFAINDVTANYECQCMLDRTQQPARLRELRDMS
jgi:hypothetical protein